MGGEEPTEAETAEETAMESENEAAADEKPVRETVVFDVDLHCGGCEDRITDALDERDGVQEVRADADEQRVEITFNPHQISTETLRQTISDFGYAVDKVEPTESKWWSS